MLYHSGILLRIYQAEDPAEVSLVGISGVVYFMASFWMTLFVAIERKQSVGRRLLIAAGICMILLFPEVLDPKISHLAHATGFVLGIPSALFYFWWNKEFIRSHEVWREKEPVWISEEDYLTIPHESHEQL